MNTFYEASYCDWLSAQSGNFVAKAKFSKIVGTEDYFH